MVDYTIAYVLHVEWMSELFLWMKRETALTQCVAARGLSAGAASSMLSSVGWAEGDRCRPGRYLKVAA